MDLEELIKLAELLEEEQPQEAEQRQNVCPVCHIDMIVKGSIYVCDRCGLSDVYNPILVRGDRWVVKVLVHETILFHRTVKPDSWIQAKHVQTIQCSSQTTQQV